MRWPRSPAPAPGAHIGEEAALRLTGPICTLPCRIGQLACANELPLNALAIGDIANRRSHQDSSFIIIIDRTQADFDREFRAVSPLPEKLQPSAHRPEAHTAHISVALGRMPIAKAFRQQALNASANEFVRRPSEQRRYLAVGELDDARIVDENHRVGRSVECIVGKARRWAQIGVPSFRYNSVVNW